MRDEAASITCLSASFNRLLIFISGLLLHTFLICFLRHSHTAEDAGTDGPALMKINVLSLMPIEFHDVVCLSGAESWIAG